MTEQTAPTAAAAPTAAPAAPPRPAPTRKKGKKKWIKRLIAIIIIAALLLGIGVGMWLLVFKEDDSAGTPLTDMSSIGSIQSVVQGYGNAVPKESAAITLTAAGTVEAVYVSVGDIVYAGDPLYTIDSQDARDKLAEAQDRVKDDQEKLNDLYEDLADLQKDLANLTVRAPFAGKLQDVQDFEIDQDVSKGEVIAKLVNDKKLKIPFYFSYAYEDDIRVGQSVSVSIPAVMGDFTGTVEKINKVSYISPEGGVHFEAVVVIDNPGTLTAGMSASAAITSGGVSIYPYEMGKTEYYEERDVTAKAGGPVSGVGNLLNYANVSSGEALLYLGSATIDSDIRDKNKDIANAQEKLREDQEAVDKAAEGLENFNAVAPIDGQIFSCTLVEGQDVKEGDTVITISNTTTMLVDIQVDSRNIGFIQAGMVMELTDDYGNPVMGTVANVAMEGEVGTGTTTYPVQLEVDNFMGTIRNGSWLNYKLVTAESNGCVVVPNQCVKRINGADGEVYTVVFVQSDTRPDNAIEVDEAMLGEALPTTGEGFWPVPVTTGISDTFNVEIVDGLEPDVSVFTNRETNSASVW